MPRSKAAPAPVAKAESPAPRPAQGPAWTEQLRLKFGTSQAHTFVLSGNVRDRVDSTNTLETFLTSFFQAQAPGAPRYDLIVFYNLARGLHFAPRREPREASV